MTAIRFTTALGQFDVELADADAPITVANFLRYVRAGAYDGAAFTRTVTPETSSNDLLPPEPAGDGGAEYGSGLGGQEADGSMPNGDVPISVVQGCPRAGWRDWAPIPMETTAATGLTHADGTISMGRLGPDTITSEFFICLGDQPQLDFGGARNPDGQGFAAFGQVSAGLAVVRAIQAAPARGQELVPPMAIEAVVVLG